MSAYQSIFQRKARPATSTDFDAAAGLSVISEYLGAQDPKNLTQKWNARIPFLPQDVATLFSSIFEDRASLRIVFDGRREQRAVDFYMRSAVLNQDFSKVMFDDLAQECTLSEIDIKEDTYRGQGMGKRWFQFMNELSVMLGHPSFTFQAGSTNGGYSWARAGAYTDPKPALMSAAHDELERLRRKLKSRIEVLSPFIPRDVYHQAYDAARIKRPDDLSTLAGVEYDLSTWLCHEMDAWRQNDFYASLSSTFNRAGASVLQKEREHASHAVMAARVQGVPLNIGRYLLSGTTWDAYVDFSDGEQMLKVGQYVGGWKTIQPV